MRLSEVPENLKKYNIRLSNGTEHLISGKVKELIMSSKTNFIELPNGNVINKSFIVEIKVNLEETRENVLVNSSDKQITKILT